MKYLLERALFHAFALQAIEGGEKSAAAIFQEVAVLFVGEEEETARIKSLLEKPAIARLKTLEDVQIFRKFAEFQSTFRLLEEEEEVLTLKVQALAKIRQLSSELRMAPFQAVAAAHGTDSAAAIFYALEILLHNRENELGYAVLSEALDKSDADAGLLLLRAGRGDKAEIFRQLAQTPDMLLHPEVLQELSEQYRIPLDCRPLRPAKFGF